MICLGSRPTSAEAPVELEVGSPLPTDAEALTKMVIALQQEREDLLKSSSEERVRMLANAQLLDSQLETTRNENALLRAELSQRTAEQLALEEDMVEALGELAAMKRACASDQEGGLVSLADAPAASLETAATSTTVAERAGEPAGCSSPETPQLREPAGQPEGQERDGLRRHNSRQQVGSTTTLGHMSSTTTLDHPQVTLSSRTGSEVALGEPEEVQTSSVLEPGSSRTNPGARRMPVTSGSESPGTGFAANLAPRVPAVVPRPVQVRVLLA